MKKKYVKTICVIAGIIWLMSISASAVTIQDNESVLYERGPNWNDYLNENGSHTLLLYSNQVNYWNGIAYEPINTDIIYNSNDEYSAVGDFNINWNGSKEIFYEKNGTTFRFIRGNISYDDLKTTYILESPRDVIPDVHENQIHFKDVYQSIDVEYVYNTNFLKQNTILNQLPALPSDVEENGSLILNNEIQYSDYLEIWTDNQIQINNFTSNGSLEFKREGATLFSLLPLKVYDANGEFIFATYQIERISDKNYLNIVIPYEWLSNSSRAYPVIIDPNIDLPDAIDTFISQKYPDKSYGDNEILRVQSYKYKNIFGQEINDNIRTLLKFTLPDYKVESISNAYLKLYSCQNHGEGNIDVMLLKPENNFGNYVSWNDYPYTGSFVNRKYVSDTGLKIWDIKSAVSNAWDKESNNNLLLLLELKYVDESSTSGMYQYFYSNKNTNYPPVIDITFTLPPPETNISKGPQSLTNNNIPTFKFKSDRESQFKIVLDGTTYELEPPNYVYEHTKTFAPLDDGYHKLKVSAKDYYGSEDASPAEWKWTIDTIAPITTINEKPGKLVNTGTAYFSFSCDEPDCKFKYRLDTKSWNNQDYGYATLVNIAQGSHTFYVKAIDPAENEGSPASYSWEIDTTPPDTKITNGPTGVISDKTAVFEFNSNDEDVAEFSYNFDNKGWISIPITQKSVTFSNLKLGEHNFKVRSKDKAGNVDPSPAERNWKIENPDLFISSFDITFTEVS